MAHLERLFKLYVLNFKTALNITHLFTLARDIFLR
jgi:hypothetical protein